MAVDYRKQYRPDQLEPFWPNEILKLSVAVLCTLAVIMFFVILPVALEVAGLEAFIHEEEPANPRGGTPVGIKPEWYFLASYQYLRLMPTELLGVSGKTLGVLSQGVLVPLVALLPFWYRRRAHERPRSAYRLGITVAIVLLVVLTIWGGWPEQHVDGHEQLLPLAEYVGSHPMIFIVFGLAAVVFFGLVAHERRTIRHVLYDDDREEGRS